MTKPSPLRARVSPGWLTPFLAAALLLAACDDGGGETRPECDEGFEAAPDGTCEPAGPGCDDGLDADGDGFCDRLSVDWSREATIPEGGDRADIYGLGGALPEVASRGIGHTLAWPIDVSGVLLPWQPLRRMLDPEATEEETLDIQDLTRRVLGFGTTVEMYEWLGLAQADGGEAMPGVPWPEGVEPGDYLGHGRVQTSRGEALSFSCATCHTAELFGRTVVGLTNRHARANEFFHLARSFFPTLTPEVFADITDANADEIEMFLRSQDSLEAVGSREPQVIGLDTSLAQVALSLSRRGEDPYATRSEELEAHPRDNPLEAMVADSKPAVWWTLKYKTRWLSDGSIVSGNPVFTNFLWNELGRGTDLRELEDWLRDNRRVVEELTAAVFATSAPRWADWFGAESIDLEAAKRGQDLFEATCTPCHGTYEKGWDAPDADTRTRADLLATTRVRYHRRTPVVDVGTDPQRAQGMAAFTDRLNDLAISQWMGTVVEVQDGYVPPPLNGIWARYPYLHNQSVPTLCDMLLPASHRPEVFWMGPADDPETDFDMGCVGFPVGDAVPEGWRDDPHARYDTTLPGLSNRGHDDWLVDDDGEPRFDASERADLVAYLKTL
ncbi:MAG: hypothetical protein ACQEXJ_12400 [Myxococcota bacterium]